MNDMFPKLGERIIQATRLAVELHLQSLAASHTPRQAVLIGGADRDWFTDELPPGGDRPRRSSLFADGDAE